MDPLLPKPEPLEIHSTISQTSSIPEIISFLKSTFPYQNFTLAQQILLAREKSLSLELQRLHKNFDTAKKECDLHSLEKLQMKDKCETRVALLEEDKRVLTDQILIAEKRYNKIMEERDSVHLKETQVLLDRIDELKTQKFQVEENLRVSQDKFSELNGRVSHLEEEIGGLLDVDVDVIRKKALDLGIEIPDRGSASQQNVLQSEVIFKSSSQPKDSPHGVKSVCNSTGNSFGNSRNKGVDNINLVPTKKSFPGDQIFQCAPSACDSAQVDSNYSNKQKDCGHSEEAEPLLNNLALENGNPTRISLACEAGDCIKNNLNAVSDKPGSSPIILIIEDDDDEMPYASKSSGLGGNLTYPQGREVRAEDYSNLAPKRKRSMSGSESNDDSSFGRQKTIAIQELVDDVKRSFVGVNSSNPEHSSKVTGVIPKPEQKSVFLRPCEGKIGSKYHTQPPPRRSDKPNGLNNGKDSDSDSDTDSCSTKNLDMYIASIKDSRKWLSEPDLLSAFELDPELCLNAICALYRRQISENDSFKAGSQIDEKSIASLGRYLTDRDHKLKRTASGVDFKYLEMCKTLAIRYCSQLFQLYHSKEDHLFCPGAAFSKL